LAGCSGRAARAGWPAARRLAGCSRAGRLLTGGAARAGTYGPPTFFNWDWGSQDAPIQDDVCLDEYNVAARMDDFVKACRELANVTRGNDIMLTMGTDFQYSNAFVWCGAGGRAAGRARSAGAPREGVVAGSACCRARPPGAHVAGRPAWKPRLGRLFSRCRSLVPLYLKCASRR